MAAVKSRRSTKLASLLRTRESKQRLILSYRNKRLGLALAVFYYRVQSTKGGVEFNGVHEMKLATKMLKMKELNFPWSSCHEVGSTWAIAHANSHGAPNSKGSRQRIHFLICALKFLLYFLYLLEYGNKHYRPIDSSTEFSRLLLGSKS